MGFFPRLLIRIAHLGKWGTPGWWVDGVMVAHGPHMVFVRFIEGNNDGASVAPQGNFHLEIRVATYITFISFSLVFTLFTRQIGKVI
jgi:hypothetical protein